MFEKFATQTAQAARQPPAVPTNTPVPQEPAAPTKEPPQEPAAPTQTNIVVPTSTPGLPANYTLQKGEFPYCIARRFNVNPSDLLSNNGLTANSTTYPGLRLKIPQNGRTFPGTRSLHKHPTTYSVKTNDTITLLLLFRRCRSIRHCRGERPERSFQTHFRRHDPDPLIPEY
jgi:LysM repeat protein